MHYKATIFFLCLLISIYSHIYSAKPKVSYTYTGTPYYYSIYLALETGLGSDDYLKITWPQAMHLTTVKNTIVVKLISFSNNLEVVTTKFIASPADATPVYYVTFGYQLTAGSWYQIQIFPTAAPTLFKGLIQVEACSTYLSNAIVYDSNLAFEYIGIDQLLSSPNTLSVAASSSSSEKSRTASIYTLLIDITPTISSSVGGNFTLQIYYDNSLPSHTSSGTTDLDFSFMGLCQSVQSPTNFTAVLNYCQISSDLSTITFSLGSFVSGTTIRISTQISNPLYVSTRGIQGYWVDFVSGKVMENGKHATALNVYTISILAPSTGRVYLLWGIDKDYSDSNTNGVLLGIYRAQSTNIGPFNSFNIGFMVNDTSPINGLYKVVFNLAATGILEGSLAHNLPAYQGKQVFCQYSVPSLTCYNVGAFINTNTTSYRYFMSGKAYYSSSTPSTISNFGDVSILPIVYNSAGSLVTVSLFTALVTATPINVYESKQFLDTSGYHSTALFQIGNAQVVSYSDNSDNSLTSTATAIQGFLQGTNSSVGIVPDLGVSQQLLFLLKVGTVSSGVGLNRSYYSKLLYNNKIIGFESGAQTRGLDFVGYDGTSAWGIETSSCYQTGKVMCQKYNADTPTFNTQVRVTTNGSNYNFYGMYKFSCGDAVTSAVCSSDCSTQCNLFTGYGLTALKSGVISMRKVTFPANYYSSVYADNTLLDFLIVFIHGSTYVSSALINGYTIVGARMNNIKAAYVNYYDHTNTNYNKGIRIPMMLRIGGGVLPSQSRGATVVGVFFDDNIDAKAFWNDTGNSYYIGCSTGNCIYYPNTGVNIIRNDIWHTNRAVYFYNLPPIQNQFNLLVPVTPSSNRNPPITLTIAFFNSNGSIAEATGLLTTLSVYRLYGPDVTSSLSGAITTINSLIRTSTVSAVSGAVPTSNFVLSWTQSGSFTYALNTSKIYESPPNNVFSYGVTYTTTYGTRFGAGITLTSFYYNIFASSTIYFQNPPINTSTTCTIFAYLYNEIQSPGTNLDRDKKWVYVAFCPIDSAMTTSSSDANIHFDNPQYPNVFTSGFPLQEVLAYAYSDPSGNLRAYSRQATAIPTITRTCSTSKLQPYYPYDTVNSIGGGKQRATFNITTSQVQMSSNVYNGYSSFRVRIDLPASTVGSALTMITGCQISDPLLSCSVTSASSASILTVISYVGTGIYTVTSFQLSLYAKATGSLGAAAAYTLTIQLPQYRTSSTTIFGDSTFTNLAQLCQCTSSFTVGITPNGASMIFNSLNTNTPNRNAKSPILFNFGSSSYRDTFFVTSQYRFNFGFLTTPADADLLKNNFECKVYENNAGSLSLSTKWASLALTPLSTVILSPKSEIANPSSILYTMKCVGSSVPTGSNTTSMSLIWYDNVDTIQSATPIAPASITSFISQASGPVALTLSTKRFRTQGFKSLYSFTITCSSLALDQNSRLYFDFHFKVPSKLDSQGSVECYTRTAAAIDDVAATYSYCQFSSDRQLVVWNNKAIAANSPLYVDIYNIDQPKVADINTANQLITLTVDTDSLYSNGVYGSATVSQIAPNANTASDIIILTTSLNTTFIRSPQTIIINMQTLSTLFTSGNRLYLVLPSAYAEWINRGSTKSLTECTFVVTGTATNLATACSFISKRILKVTVSSVTNTLFTLTINNIYSPSTLPSGKYNQFRFKLFAADPTEVTINHYTFYDYSAYLTLQPDSNLIDLSWVEYTLSQGDALISLTASSTITERIYIGYYSNVIELRQSIYPTNFKTSMTLLLNNFGSTQFPTLQSSSVSLGKPTSYFRFAATTNISAGLYVLSFTKSGDPNNLYTAIPPLTLVVSNTLCYLTTKQVSYTLPVGGSTLPIVIDALNCIPISNIVIGLTFDRVGVSINTDLSSLTLSSSTLDGKLYIVLKHVSSSLASGQVVTVSFTISGPNAASYGTIPQITLTVVDPTSYQIIPSATALTTPVLISNTAKFTLQCNMGSTIYWGLGIYPSILNSQASDFQGRIISKLTGLQTNFTETNDIYGRVYGVNYVTTTQTLIKTLYNLKSNTDYIFKYFCVNQLGFSSDSQSNSFSSLNYGAYLMKVSMTFRGSINYGQYHDLSCALAENFVTPYSRVMTEVMSYCYFRSTIFYPSNSSTIANAPDTNNQYIYNFYILPDYSLPTDSTNINIRSQLSLHSFTTQIITSTASSSSLPQFVQMQTQDIQVFVTPTITISDVVSGLNSVLITGVLTNMNGFIVVGVMSGVFDSSSMTLPTTYNIKNGLFQNNQTLLSVKMQYASQNLNVTVGIDTLSAATTYTAYYFGTSDDPTYTAVATSVSYITFKTLQVLDININWQFYHPISFLLLTILFLLLS